MLSVRFGAVRKAERGPECRAAHARPLRVEPILEVGRAPDVECGQKLTAVERDGRLEIPALHGVVKRRDIAPQATQGDAHLVVPPGQNHRRTQLATQPVQRLAQRVARPGLVELRPQDGQKRVSPHQPRGAGEGQVAEQGESLWLQAEVPWDGATRAQAHRAQEAQLERHGRNRKEASPVIRVA